MKLLLDTHSLLWWIRDDAKLKPKARAAILSPDNDVMVSVGSLWEILVKVRARKLEANIEELEQAISDDGFRRLSISSRHLITLAGLPAYHRDPFDHLLIAQAISEDCTLLSSDAMFARYPVRLL